MRTALVAQHAQVVRQQHGGLRRQQCRALRLGILNPLATRLVVPRVARVLDQDHDGVGVLVDGPMHLARRLQHVGQDHVHAGREAGGLVGLEFAGQRVNPRVAYRLGQQRRARQPAHRHHRSVEVVASGLEVVGALLRRVRHFATLGVHGTVAHKIEHGHETRHRVFHRLRVRIVERQRLHRRDRRELGAAVLARQALERVRAEVNRAVAVGEKAHGPFSAQRDGRRLRTDPSARGGPTSGLGAAGPGLQPCPRSC